MQKKRFALRTALAGLVALWVLTIAGTVQAAGLQTIEPEKAAGLIAQHRGDPAFVILDIRTPAEFKSGHLEKAVLLDYYSKSFWDQVKLLDRNKTYLMYCRSGNRSGRALRQLEGLGFQEVYDLAGGIGAWQRKGYAVTAAE